MPQGCMFANQQVTVCISRMLWLYAHLYRVSNNNDNDNDNDNNNNNNNNTIWGGSVLTGEEPSPQSGELKHALPQAGGPTQSQLSRPMSSGHHISMEHRLLPGNTGLQLLSCTLPRRAETAVVHMFMLIYYLILSIIYESCATIFSSVNFEISWNFKPILSRSMCC